MEDVFLYTLLIVVVLTAVYAAVVLISAKVFKTHEENYSVCHPVKVTALTAGLLLLATGLILVAIIWTNYGDETTRACVLEAAEIMDGDIDYATIPSEVLARRMSDFC